MPNAIVDDLQTDPAVPSADAFFANVIQSVRRHQARAQRAKPQLHVGLDDCAADRRRSGNLMSGPNTPQLMVAQRDVECG